MRFFEQFYLIFSEFLSDIILVFRQMGSTPPGLIKLTRQLNALKNEVDENKKKIDDLEKENEELKDLTEKYKTGNSSKFLVFFLFVF